MIDITKEDFWASNSEEVERTKNDRNKVKNFILNHKIITMLLISLGMLMTINTILVYNFFKIITNI